MSGLEAAALKVLGLDNLLIESEQNSSTAEGSRIIELIRRGLPVASALRVAHFYNASNEELSVLLGTSERTLSRRKREAKSLAPTESNRLYQLARIAARAQEVFEDTEIARRWFRRPNRALGGAVPFNMLDTDMGAEEIDQVLTRIEYGIYS
ncbi:MAG: DUF2384 domain-containing protein [Gemmatimonadaceae bacterium]|nr:DUF2384 domain-containing protein [Gloeobacterales cyanobacterium ES-bin-141]